MEQHPIPQNISSYEFRLVGDMTLKQFFQLAFGIVLALVFFRLPLPGLIKYPLVGLSVLMGIAMAFIPVNGRPFTQWLTAFIRAIYAPTEFTWQRTETALSTPIATTPPPSSTPPPTPPSSPDLARVASTAPLPPVPKFTPPIEAVTPKETSSIIIRGQPSPYPKPPETPIQAKPTSPPLPTPSAPENSSFPSSAQSSAKNTVQPVYQSGSEARSTSVATPAPLAPITSQINPPTYSNILTGQIITSDGNALEGAIIEIIDSTTSIPVRALRSNRTGLFQIATPLSQGTYQVQVEKEGFLFSPVSITAANSIIQPIVITATAKA